MKRYLLKLLLPLAIVIASGWAGQAFAAAAVSYVNASIPFAWIDPSTHTKLGPTYGGLYSPTYKFTNGPGPANNNTFGCGTTPPIIDDTTSDQIPFGFIFPFGTSTFNSARINTNGRLQLTRSTTLTPTLPTALDNTTCGYGSYVQQLPFPDAGLTNTLRIYGNDLDHTSKTEVPGYATLCTDRTICYLSYASIGTAPNRKFVVTWSNVPEWTNTNTTGGNYNLQLIVQENGEFIYQYGTDSAGPQAALPQVGWQISTTDYEVVSVGFPANNTAVRFYIPKPILEYKMEQAPWTTAAGQVTDTSGNNNNGTALGALTSVVGGNPFTPGVGLGKVCRAASIPANTAAATKDAIDTGLVPATGIGAAGLITFWYRANTAWSTGSPVAATLLDATTVDGTYFFLVRLNTGALRFVVTDSNGTVQAVQTGVNAIAAGTWTHIAVSWNFNALAAANSDALRIYVNGGAPTSASFTTSGTLPNTLGSLYIGDSRGVANGQSSSFNSADGWIDEVRIYNYEGGQALVQSNRDATAVCPVINNFLFNTGSSIASTCFPKNITITAQGAGGVTLTTYTGLVNISTSTNHGTWAKVSAGGNLTSGSDTGVATYGFAASDLGVITLSLSNTHAETLSITVVDSGTPTSATISSSITFSDNTFVIAPTDSLGYTAVAGRPHAMKAELYTTNGGTTACQVVNSYGGSKNLDAWFEVDVSHPVGAAAPAISTGVPPGSCNISPSLALTTTVPSLVAGTNNLSGVPFVNGRWDFCLSTTDVGKFVLGLRDDTGSSVYYSAANTQTVRPFALGISSIQKGATVNPGGTASGGTKFVAAEDTFQATVAAYRWQSADDANNDGVPDAGADVTNNGTTASFKWDTTVSATTPITPAAGTLGALGGTVAIPAASFASGAYTVANLTYSEVGSMTLQATASNYLNSGFALTGTSTPVGRFYPDHFALTSVSLIAACPGVFSYMDQNAMSLAYSVQAQGKNNGLIANYSAILGYSPLATVSLVAENNNAGVNLGARFDNLALGAWANGQFLVNATKVGSFARFARAASPDGPYDALAIGVKTVDATDGVNLTALDMNAATTGNCATGSTCDARQLGGVSTTTRVRYGRLWLQNANGSELLGLPVPMETQYYNGNGFLTNTLDSCTTITAANIGLGNYQGNLAAGQTTATLSANTFAAGKTTLKLSAPGAARNGAVSVVANVGTTTTIDNNTTCLTWNPALAPAAASLPWLTGQWCGASANKSPTARATFGTYRSTNKFIFQRENY